MGVRGLRAYIQSVLEKKLFEELGTDGDNSSNRILHSFQPEVLPNDSILLVDASSFLFYLIKSNPNINFTTFAALGGDYSLLDEQIRKHVFSLESFGIELKFILDGRQRSNTMKQVALKRRLMQRETAWTEMFTWCNKTPRPELDSVHQAMEENPPDLPIPPLCFHQLVSTLKDLQLEVIEAPGEADDLIAEMCSLDPKAFCYAMDTDYIAIRDCRYIEIGSIMTSSASMFGAAIQIAEATVWTRTKTSALLGLTEHQFVEMCILAGNDYTEGFDISNLSIVSSSFSSTPIKAAVEDGSQTNNLKKKNETKSGGKSNVVESKDIGMYTPDNKNASTPTKTVEKQSPSTPKISSAMSFGNKVTFARNLSSESQLGCPTDDSFDLAIKYSRAFYNRENIAFVGLDKDQASPSNKIQLESLEDNMMQDLKDYIELCADETKDLEYNNKSEFSRRMHPLRFLEYYYAQYPESSSSSSEFSFDKVIPREYVKILDLVERVLIVKNHDNAEISTLTDGLIIQWPPYKRYLGLYYFQLLIKSMNNKLEKLNHRLLVPAKICNGLIFNILAEAKQNGAIFPAHFAGVVEQAKRSVYLSADGDVTRLEPSKSPLTVSAGLPLHLTKNKSEKKPSTPKSSSSSSPVVASKQGSALKKQSQRREAVQQESNGLTSTNGQSALNTPRGASTVVKGQAVVSPSVVGSLKKPMINSVQQKSTVTPVQASVSAKSVAPNPVATPVSLIPAKSSSSSTPTAKKVGESKSASEKGKGENSALETGSLNFKTPSSITAGGQRSESKGGTLLIPSGTPKSVVDVSNAKVKSKANQNVSDVPATGEKSAKAVQKSTPKPAATPVSTPAAPRSSTKPVSTPPTTTSTAKQVATPSSTKPVVTPASAKPIATPASAKPIVTPSSASKSASKGITKSTNNTPKTGAMGPKVSSNALQSNVKSAKSVEEPSKLTSAVKGSSSIKTPSSKGKASNGGGGSTGVKSGGEAFKGKTAASPFAPRQLSLDHHSSSSVTPKHKSVKQHPSIMQEQSESSDDAQMKVVYKEPEAPLPIEGHRQELLQAIRTNVVTIVQGETGCGKSTKIPEYVYHDCQSRKVSCKMMLCQPRRLATYSLLHRLRSVFGDVVGMRMGNDTRDESKETRIWVVTTGYLMQLLASMPHYLVDRGFTHLIMDEVHERSVECDVTVYLARELLLPKVKLVLMSATANAGLYQSYFKAPPPLFVGARRYPVEIYYLDELAEMPELSYAPIPHHQITSACAEFRNSTVGKPSPKLFFFQANMVKFLVRALGSLSRSILIFVSGMQAILDLFDAFAEDEAMFRVLAVHSEIPFEEQAAIFSPSDDDPRTRVILATNAAESSITLPDVDLVLCLGTQKELVYDPQRHTSVLAETFISKSSAIQRAGRTGRVREGTVIRLYPRNHYEQNMSPHETVEILRKPLDDTILQLRSSFENSEDFEGVVPVLRGLIQPPDMSNVKRSFTVLFREKMITRPNDEGKLTSMGKFASTLNIGYRGSQLIAKGIALGVGAEAVVLAAAICQPKTVFRIASRVVHTDPTELYEILRTVTIGAMKLDCGVRSEPLMMLQLFKVYSLIPPAKQSAWLLSMGIVQARLKQFVATAKYLLMKLAKDIPNMDELFDLKHLMLSESKLNRLRFLLFDNCQGAIARLKVDQPTGFHHRKYLLRATGALKDEVTSEMIEKQLWPANIRNAIPGHPMYVRIEPLPFGYTGKMRRDLFETNDMQDWAGRLQAHYMSFDDNARIWIIVDRPRQNRIVFIPESDVDKIVRDDNPFEYVRIPYEPKVKKQQSDRIDDLEKAFEALRIKRDGDQSKSVGEVASSKKKKKQVPWAMFELSLGTQTYGAVQAMAKERTFLRSNAPAYVYMEVESNGRTQFETCNVPIPPNIVDFLDADFTKLVPQGIGNITWTQEDFVDDPRMEFKDVPLAYKLMLRYKVCERNKDRAPFRIVIVDRPLGADTAAGPLQICEVDSSIDMPKFTGVKVDRKREFKHKKHRHRARYDSDDDDFDDEDYDNMDYFSSDPEEDDEDEDSVDSEEEIIFGISARAVLLSQTSMLCASVHAPKSKSTSSENKYLYVITSALSMYGGAYGFDTPTFLPPGGRWLQLACECSGWQIPFQKGFDPGYEYINQQCAKVAKTMNSIMLQAIERNDELIDLVDEIFGDFINVDYKRELGVDLSVLGIK